MDIIVREIHKQIKGSCYFTLSVITKIIQNLQNDQYLYSSFVYNFHIQNSLSLSVIDEKSKEPKILEINIKNQNQHEILSDQTGIPISLKEFLIEDTFFVKEFDVSEYQLSSKMYKLKDLKYCKSLDHVKFISDDIVEEDVGEFISQSTNLLSFSLKFITKIHENQQFLQSLLNGLKLCNQIQSLRISLYKCERIQQYFLDFFKNISQFKNLRYLKLSQCGLSYNDDEYGIFGDYIKYLKNLIHLEIVIWSQNLNSKQLQSFFQNLHSCENLKIIIINIQENTIKDKGLSLLGKYLAQCPNLERIYLDIWKNQVQFEGIKNFLIELQMNQKLNHLSLLCLQNSISDQEIVSTLLLLKHLKSLRRLDLDLNREAIFQCQEDDELRDQLLKELRTFSHLIEFNFNPYQNSQPNKLTISIKKNIRLVKQIQLSIYYNDF